MSHWSVDDFLDFGPAGGYERLELPAPAPLKATGPELLELPSATLEALARRAFSELAFRLPVEQVEGLASVLDDPDASEADRFVAAELLRNAAVAAEGLLPICQDTGTAVAYGWKGAGILTDGRDERAIAEGARAAYAEGRLRASQLVPTGFLAEANSGDNLPALVELRAAPGWEYRLCFAAKGGGSANRTSLSMESPALLAEAALEARLEERIMSLGAAGCPPYRISAVLGGAGPDEALRALALAGLGLLDSLPASGEGGSPLRDRGWEARIEALAAATGVGAQLGGSRMALDARAIRLSRHAASLPLALGVCCAANRRAKARIGRDGVWLERLEADPARLLPADLPLLPGARRVDLDRPQAELAAELGSLEPGTFLLLSGTVATARDAAHARFRALLAAGSRPPAYLLAHPVFYAGPTEAAPGRASGSFGPTTAGRMDGYLDELMGGGASLVSIAKGGRSKAAREAIARRGGAYLACVGGAAALAAREHVVSSRVVDHADLGMEAVRLVVLRDLPAMLVVDGRGRDFYERGR